jgi:hypothetical protein
MTTDHELEILWNALLSRRKKRIHEAFKGLDAANQKVVLTHLQRMVHEDGWQTEQVCSAQAALLALKDYLG